MIFQLQILIIMLVKNDLRMYYENQVNVKMVIEQEKLKAKLDNIINNEIQDYIDLMKLQEHEKLLEKLEVLVIHKINVHLT